jgi:dUTP pyrophosphatase
MQATAQPETISLESRLNTVQVRALDHFDDSLGLPFYATADAAGADIKACFADRKGRWVQPQERCLIPTGLSFGIPSGFEIQVRPRSGLSLKSPLLVVNAPGTIDADYRGEVQIIIGNFGQEPFWIEHGMRLAQLVLAPVWQAQFKAVEVLSTTERGAGGFGSTGTH